MTAVEGYWKAYSDFYQWKSIWRGASTKDSAIGIGSPHRVCRRPDKAGAMWDWVIRSKRVANLRPALEAVLTGFGRYTSRGTEKELGDNLPSATAGRRSQPSAVGSS